MAPQKLKLCFLIRQMNDGGAQRQLLELVRGLDRDTFEITVITFYKGGRYWDRLSCLPRTQVRALHKRGRWDFLFFSIRLLCELKVRQPDIIHSYLGLANVLAALFKPFFPRSVVVWGVRSGPDLYHHATLADKCVHLIQTKLSGRASLVIVNSYSAARKLALDGLSQNSIVVIHNGINTDEFYPMAQRGRELRRNVGIDSESLVIGIVGRLAVEKGYPIFLKAASLFLEIQASAQFVCVGSGTTQYKASLLDLARKYGVSSRILWLDPRTDMGDVYSMFDVYTSTSLTESFSNSIAEAMACAIPCVVTDVGDSARIVGNAGITIPPGDPKALVKAWHELSCMPLQDRHTLGAASRQRIVDLFSLERMISATRERLLLLMP